MIAYFARRIAGGAVMLFFAMFVVYTLIIYAPAGAKDEIEVFPPPTAYNDPHAKEWQDVLRWYEKQFKFDRPWPVSYLAWLFDPDDTIDYRFEFVNGENKIRAYKKGIDLFGIRGNGVLTGYFGESIIIGQRELVTDMFGEHLGMSLLFLALLPFVPLAFLLVRRNRPGIDVPPNHPQSRRLYDQYTYPLRASWEFGR